MIQIIKNNRKIYSIIIRKKFKYKGIKFFTPSNFSQQLGYMSRPKNYTIKPHKHRKVKRSVSLTQEVLFVKSGKVEVSFYNQKNKIFKKVLLSKGDIILLANGGHSFKMLKKTEMIEVKQGPYKSDKDKIFI